MRIRDRQILEAASRGNRDALQNIWEIWSPRILIFMENHHDISRQDAEDLLQEVMAKVFRSLKNYNPLYSPATWIYTIASRTLADWRRKDHRRLKAVNESELDKEETGETYFSRQPGTGRTPEQEYIRRESINCVRDFILSRTGSDRQLLLLVCYEGMSGRKAASLLGIPVSTAKDRLRKLKKELQEVLE